MNESKASKAQNLARIRDNQRRSRARRKEYLQELEAKLRGCEQMGVEASAEIQSAARKVLEENRKLRALLRDRGVTEAEITAVTGSNQRSLDNVSAAPSLNSMLERRITCNRVPYPSSSSSPSPSATAAVLPTTTLAPISIPAHRPAPISEYDSQSPLSIDSSVETPPQFNNTPFYPNAMTPTPEIKSETMASFNFSFDQSQQPMSWNFSADSVYSPDAMTYYNTSCIDAANIIRGMTVDVGPELEADLGCRTATQNCYVNNSLMFNVMDKYSAPINGII
ncbi:hypothetical protein EJ04DRAFT_528751 [Polyplosphaeria fusca]|uniref:BZIP domain-containing protein n=1 Tax=Polyplosphaeria fusca TaxID=682080 RepID=A0A9P4QL30_9PLEO|nr:hypothetical protein EJ04DRAFT_528751 [Polyplosphaeria fusca]